MSMNTREAVDTGKELWALAKTSDLDAIVDIVAAGPGERHLTLEVYVVRDPDWSYTLRIAGADEAEALFRGFAAWAEAMAKPGYLEGEEERFAQQLRAHGLIGLRAALKQVQQRAHAAAGNVAVEKVFADYDAGVIDGAGRPISGAAV